MLCIAGLVMQPACGSGADDKAWIEEETKEAAAENEVNSEALYPNLDYWMQG